MVRFGEDLAYSGVVGRYYRCNGAEIKGAKDSSRLIAKVTSLDVAYSEVHYTLFSKDGEIVGRFGCPIEQFAIFGRASRGEIRKIEKKITKMASG